MLASCMFECLTHVCLLYVPVRAMSNYIQVDSAYLRARSVSLIRVTLLG